MGLNPDGLGRTVRENLLPVYTNHTCLATLIAEATQALKEQHSPPPHYVSGGRLVQHTGRAGITRKIEVMEIKEQRNSTRVIKHKTCFITVSAMDFRCYKLSIVWFWRNLKSVYSFLFFFHSCDLFFRLFIYKKKNTLPGCGASYLMLYSKTRLSFYYGALKDRMNTSDIYVSCSSFLWRTLLPVLKRPCTVRAK